MLELDHITVSPLTYEIAALAYFSAIQVGQVMESVMAAVIKFDACRLQTVSVSALRDRSTCKVIEAEVMECIRVQREARIARERAAFADALDPRFCRRACRDVGRRRSERRRPASRGARVSVSFFYPPRGEENSTPRQPMLVSTLKSAWPDRPADPNGPRCCVRGSIRGIRIDVRCRSMRPKSHTRRGVAELTLSEHAPIAVVCFVAAPAIKG